MSKQPEGHPDPQDLTVVIHDEDAGGEPFAVHAGPGTPIDTIIARFYEKLGVARQEGDRLYCIGNGDDVFGHGGEHLGAYRDSCCTALEWGFARATGGA